MNILVTGGAGFIGSHLVDTLVEAGHDVTVLDDLSSGRKEYVNQAARFCQGDVRDTEALDRLFAGTAFDVVFHGADKTQAPCSMLHPREEADVSILGLINVLEHCRRHDVKKILLSSSAAVYGNQEKGLADETAPVQPQSFYGLTKAAAEAYAALYHRMYGLPYAVLRYANVYGERQGSGTEDGVVSLFSRALAAGNPMTIYGDGNQSRDFIYVRDAASASMAAMAADVPSGIYNISTKIETTINALKEILMYFAQIRTEVTYEEARSGDIYRSVLDNGKAVQALNWRPKTKLLPGLMTTFSYFLGRDEL